MPDEYNEPWVNEFMEKLIRTKDKNIKSIIGIKNEHVPDTLYRYRELNTYTINTFNHHLLSQKRLGEHAVWLSHPYKFINCNPDNQGESEDQLINEVDSVMKFSDDSLNKYALIQVCRNYLVKMYGEDKTHELIDTITITALFNLVISTIKENGCPNPDYEFSKLKIKAEDNIQFCRKSIRDRIYNGLGIGCFTTDKYSDYMWKYYADHGRGICLEYDMTRYSNNDPQKNEMYPVYYTDEIRDMSYLINENHDRNFWDTQILPVILTKHTRYKDEKEWRLVVGNKSDNNGLLYPFIKPSRIYLGCAMTRPFRRKITRIAKENNIPVIRIKKVSSENTYIET